MGDKESDRLAYKRRKKKRPMADWEVSDDQTHCSVDEEDPTRRLRWHNDECFGLAKSTVATGRNNAGPSEGTTVAASGVEWSLKGRFAPLPVSPQARMDEAQKLSNKLRALMDNTCADPSSGGALRVKLQSLLVLLQKDASQAVEDHRLNDYTILSGVADEVHALLDAHELFVRSKHSVEEDWESDDDDDTAWDLRSTNVRSNPNGESIRHALLRRNESAEMRKATAVQDRLVTDCRRSGSTAGAYERGHSFEHYDPRRNQGDHYSESIAPSLVRGAATPSSRARGLERNESHSSASADELLRLKQRIADLETILHVQREKLRDAENVDHIRRMWIHDSARAQKLSEQVRELENDISRRDQMILTLQETLRRCGAAEAAAAAPPAPQATAVTEGENRGTPPRHLLFSDAGLIFEEQGAIEIGCKIRTEGSRVVMRLYLGNLSAGALDGLDVQFTAPRALLVIHEDFPLTILPSQQVAQNVSFICRSFFVSAPMVTVSFLMPHCQSRSITVALPVSIARFCTPAPLTLKDYKQLSCNIKFTLNEVSGVFAADCKFSRIKDKLLATGAFEYIPSETESTKLLFAAEAQLESEPANLALVGLQLSRGNKVRLVIQSGNNTLSEGLFYGVKAHLS